ncbi:hypothetical protein Asppvi_001692 [Aspergillus pseudoviridinutans]|uniref:Uncharacterized protein n=1 Tax=Aspergillus pseudoviridinutans TaxID=1517512 RepID=A0A9P3B5J2_9EURO|nr:uncharacterized protein Asppvi_001692 [Aspergillus pseudoviridinutans]GIJ83173.1 hypothetical protein Asppvi_001692 [Aspergillus pseudoviridinutans]
MPRQLFHRLRRKPTRSGPIASATALATSNHEPCAVGHAPALFDLVHLSNLIDQMPVGAVDIYAVEACVNGVVRAGDEVADDAYAYNPLWTATQQDPPRGPGA